MTKIITRTGFYASGSGAVTDFFSEFDSVCSLTGYEFRFMQDPWGISDLEFNLVENPHRHNSSNALKQYLRFVKLHTSWWYTRGYKKTFGDQFAELSKTYIDNLTDLKTKSWWHWDQIEKGMFFTFIDRFYSRLRRALPFNKKLFCSLLQRNELGYFSCINEERFLSETRKYTSSLFQSANTQNKPFIMVDQLVSPSNPSRYLRYLDDAVVFVVDRDPRDLYLEVKNEHRAGIVPTETVEDFIEWFKITRAMTEATVEPKENVFYLQFEDLIYNYEETAKLLVDFAGVDRESHRHPRTKFIPEVSKKNTNLAPKTDQDKKDIERIEEELHDYLYQF